MNKKYTLELRTDGTLPFAWWWKPAGKEFSESAKLIPPPEEWNVRAYKNYNDKVVKKYKLPITVTFKKGFGGGIYYTMTQGGHVTDQGNMYRPSNIIPKKK